jgi:hypothetical protein
MEGRNLAIVQNDNAEATINPFYDLNLLRHILLYVGRNQYRFVAAINHDSQQVLTIVPQ